MTTLAEAASSTVASPLEAEIRQAITDRINVQIAERFGPGLDPVTVKADLSRRGRWGRIDTMAFDMGYHSDLFLVSDGTIHLAAWSPDVDSREFAAHYVVPARGLTAAWHSYGEVKNLSDLGREMLVHPPVKAK